MYVDAGCLTVLDYDFMVENGADFKDKGVYIDTGGDGDFPLQLIIDGKKFLFK